LVKRKKNEYYSLTSIFLLMLVLWLTGCEPTEESAESPKRQSSRRASAQTPKRNSPRDELVELACNKILVGDFEAAGQIIESAPAPVGASLNQLKTIVARYKDLNDRRAEARIAEYNKQIEELEKFREKTTKAQNVIDVNDLSSIFSTIIMAVEYADEELKRELLDDEFVKQTIKTALEKARQFEKQGEWINAYAKCYYWLNALGDENNQYKEQCDELAEMAMMEMDLVDNSCGNTSEARHKGIKPEMLLRAIAILDKQYVSNVDYREMAENALKQGLLIVRVMAKSKKKIAYKVQKKKMDEWTQGINAIREELNKSFIAVTRDRFNDIFGEVMALNVVTINIPQEVVVAQFSESALNSLDPFTEIVWPWQVEDFQKNMTQQFTGIGVEISKATGELKVVSLLPDTPAYTSGLDAEDTIAAIDGEATKDMTILCAVSKITGPKGTNVTLTIKHAGSDETEDITITRGKIVVPSTRGWRRAKKGKWDHMIDPKNGIAFIRITNFTENTVPRTEKILKDLEAKGLKGLIIDLRSNTGGYLVTASAVVDLFVSSGLIVKSQPKWGFSTWEIAHPKGTHPDYPIVILINGISASASEIVAGALQDPNFKRATLVGTRTYGKGSVQVVREFGDGSQLKYTMAYYHLPSDQRVKNRYIMKKQGRTDWGIAPDVEVRLRKNEKIITKEMRDMIEVQRQNDILTKAKHDDNSNPVKRHQLAEIIESDPQLATAILVLKAKIIRAGGKINFDIEAANVDTGTKPLSDGGKRNSDNKS
jgi:carboxyl-terminal processing protease